MAQRDKDTSKARGMHKAQDIAYNEQAGGFKQVGPILGQLKRLYTIDTEQALTEITKSGSIIAFYNPTSSTAWLILKEGAGPIGTPSALEASSIALKPNDYTVLALNEKVTSMISDAAVVAYLVQDDSVLK